MVAIFIFLLGLAIGSFLNVLIDRLPAEESIGGRSHCDNCKKTLSWIDLIPVFSWVYLRGKSRCCHKKISMFYPIVELLTGISFFFVFISYPTSTSSFPLLTSHILTLIIICFFIVIFFADLKYHIIPDEMTILLVLIGIILMFLRQSFFDYFFGALLLSLIMYGIYAVTKGRGMGFGDVKLAFPMGLILGIKSGFIALYLSFIIGGFFSLLLIIIHKRNLKSKIAFGPFMIIGFALMFFYNDPILNFIQNHFGF
ncbi:hypothetical protein A3H78_02705 [Candidatus Roizmanbacteria bacterium RIFCSPLOWO2_02_FULL_36_11]|uniref:Prepilin peptidase n=1 Tax=Candidatus Roizmanbacteria bacterium RIFCSPLOWO2_02_FULL_36_11 TaxID=1802071 RepID=A0A1F7JCU3_9BACT|nr:MAG: hypothetical protein A3H78_02705 [Candidatus Roizmanbacteria bacterium RIFCSPLOWO2_02_FULL_36_11]